MNNKNWAMFWSSVSGLFVGNVRSSGYKTLNDEMIVNERGNEFIRICKETALDYVVVGDPGIFKKNKRKPAIYCVTEF
jgi:hypothetical protein